MTTKPHSRQKNTEMLVLRNRKRILPCCAAAFLCMFGISGCKAETEAPSVIDIPRPSHTATMPPVFTAAPSATPFFSPAPTVFPVPDATITAAPTEKAEKTEKSYPVEDMRFYYQALDDALKKRITGMSFPEEGEECRIKYDDLRYVVLLYCDFDGNTHEGELIVHRKVAKEVTEIFYELYQNGYPLASVRLVDDYGEPGDDNLSMADNNSSAFNYRRVTGSKTLSRHSYGAAIDINPLFNPYIDGDRVAPPEGKPYADRDWDFPGKIDHDDLCYRLFTRKGWTWGGDWKGDKDYQHFSKDLGY